MYLFLDTEFTDFGDCDLISLGLVSEDGEHEFYVEISDHKVEWQSDFVKDTVVPLLTGPAMKHVDAGFELATWLNKLPKSGELVFVADFSTDFRLLADLLRDTVVNRAMSASIVTKAFLQAAHERGFHSGEVLSAGFKQLVQASEEYFVAVDKRQHHALVDAKAARYAWVRAVEAMKNEG